MICPNCKNEIANGVLFCDKCGTVMPAQTPQPVDKKVSFLEKIHLIQNGKLNKKALFIGGGTIAAIVLIIFVCTLIFGGNENNPLKDQYFYISDKEIQFHDLSKDAPHQITSQMIKEYYDIPVEKISNHPYPYRVVTSKDQSKLLYPDLLEGEAFYTTLYLKNLNNLDEDPVMIDNRISQFYTNEDITGVVYLKDDRLYRHDLQENELIFNDVSSFVASEDLNIIYFVGPYDKLYIYQNGKTEMISNVASSMFQPTGDFNTVYYINNDYQLYMKTVGKDAEKIDNHLFPHFLLMDPKTDTLYYAKDINNSQTYYYSDFIMDDCDSDLFDYFKSDHAFDIQFKEVYTCNGSESKCLFSSAILNDCRLQDNGLVIMFSEVHPDDVKKVEASRIEAEFFNDSLHTLSTLAENMVMEAIADASTVYVLTGGNTIKTDIDSTFEFNVSPDCDQIIYTANIDQESYKADLYVADISGKQFSPRKIDEGVTSFSSSFSIYEDGTAVYLKNASYSDYTAQLYMNGKEIDSEACVYGYSYVPETKSLFYLSDWNEDELNGTLMVYDGKHKEKIKEDVLEFDIQSNNCLYLCNYEDYHGDLYLYKNGKSQKLDEDVTCIIDSYFAPVKFNY